MCARACGKAVLGTMGKIKSMDVSLNRYRGAVLAMLAFALTIMPFAPSIVLAQDASPGGFSLPAGAPPQQEPPSNVQGPVDSESTPPRRTDQPAQSTPAPSLPTIAPMPVPVPTPQPRQATPPRERPAPAPTQRDQRSPTPAETQRAAPAPAPAPAPKAATPDDDAGIAPAAQAPSATPLPVPAMPDLPVEAPGPEADAAEEPSDGSTWLWLAAGLVALASLIVMGLRQRSAARPRAAEASAPFVPTATVPTPPLRSQPRPVQPDAQPSPQLQPKSNPQPAELARTSASSVPFGTVHGGGTSFGLSPAPSPAPITATAPTPSPEPTPTPAHGPAPAPASVSAPIAHAAPIAQPPRLLLDFTTLGVDVTLVNAVARYHLAITNMADIPVSDVALHGSVVQARRGMPPTIDPMLGDSLLPLLQKVADIAPDGTQRCEGQIRLPLQQIEPIEMQGRLLFVPVVHIWIGYSGPDGTRYAVTQSFVLGEESSPPGPRVGPLRLDLGPRRFTGVGQRPLQPA